jgi:hypothetical protein
MAKNLINFIAFQIGWLACVLGAGYGLPMTGPIVVAVLLGLHFFLTADPTAEVRFIVAVGLIGSTVDSLLSSAGAYSFFAPLIEGWLCPLWITSLWMNFATTFNASLSWLAGRYVLGGVFGAVGGPLSYYAGARLGAVELHPNPLLSMVILAIAWGITMPGLLRLAKAMVWHPQPERQK